MTRFETLNSIIESIYINVEYSSIGKRKTVLSFEKYIFSQLFIMPVHKKFRYLSVVAQCAIFETSHDYVYIYIYLKKKLYYRGSKTLKSEYSRNISLRKNNKKNTVSKFPGRGLLNALRNGIFEKKCAAPLVYCRCTLT